MQFAQGWRPPKGQQPLHRPLQLACLQAVKATVAQGEYASYAAIVQEVCRMHSVGSLEQLGVAVSAVPVLALLWHIEHRVGAYLVSFNATHGIACYMDFEAEATAMLNSCIGQSIC